MLFHRAVFLFIICLLTPGSGVLLAQSPQPTKDSVDFPPVELSLGLVGGSISPPGLDEPRNTFGAGAGITWNLNRHFGLTAEVTGQLNVECQIRDRECSHLAATIDESCLDEKVVDIQNLDPGCFNFDGDTGNQFVESAQVLAGPRMTYRRKYVGLFTHVLGGINYSSVDRLPTKDPDIFETFSARGLALSVGGGVDIGVGGQSDSGPWGIDRMRLRTDFIRTRWNSTWTNDWTIRWEFVWNPDTGE